MQVNNNTNNQPIFGMRSFVTYNLTPKVEKMARSLEAETLKMGHAAAECMIEPGEKPKTVKVRVLVGVADASPIVGIAEGKIWFQSGLRKLIALANAALNQEYIHLRLPANPTKADFDFSTTINLGVRDGQVQEIKKVAAKVLLPDGTPTPPKIVN